MKLIITGGCGFIGSNFIKYLLKKTNYKILNIDKQTYAGINDNLDFKLPKKRYTFIKLDINNKKIIKLLESFKADALINFAAESHVDRSITSAKNFIYSNILGVYNLLEASKEYSHKKKNFIFFQISTDEVYGSLKKNEASFKETNKFFPNSPYSSSKASADLLVRSYNKTYNLRTLITNCSNNYGPRQDFEKLIPKIIYNALKNKKIPIYGNGLQVRDWINVNDHCEAIFKVLKKGKFGENYNIGGDFEVKNIDLTRIILKKIEKKINKKLENLITYVKDRPAHDTRYAISNKKIQSKIKWKAKVKFTKGIDETIDWYISKLKL